MSDSNPPNLPDIKLIDALQKIEIFPHGVNYKPAVEALTQLLLEAIVAELNLLDEALFPHPYKRINFTKLKEYKAERINELTGDNDLAAMSRDSDIERANPPGVEKGKYINIDNYEQIRCDNCGLPGSATYGDGKTWKLCGPCYMKIKAPPRRNKK